MLLLPTLTFSIGNIKICYYIDGYWSDWIENSNSSLFKDEGNGVSYRKWSFYHPSDYCWKITRNERIKEENDGWAVFSGTLEYYITDERPSLKLILKNGDDGWVDPKHHDEPNETPCVKRVIKATIKMKTETKYIDNVVGYNIFGRAKYRREYFTQCTYNIFTSEGGFAISFRK